MAPASVSYGLALLNYVRSGIVARVRGKDVSGEGVGGGGREKEGRNARWPARYTAERPLDSASVSLSRSRAAAWDTRCP